MIGNRFKVITVSLLCLTLLFGLCSVASATTTLAVNNSLQSSNDLTLNNGVEPYRGHDYMVTASTLNVRSGAGTNYSIVGQLYYGNIVQGYKGEMVYANGYWWMQVWNDYGLSGWAIENHLKEIS